eukprot:6190443-Pleurochrysis_carterae.AAC.8
MDLCATVWALAVLLRATTRRYARVRIRGAMNGIVQPRGRAWVHVCKQMCVYLCAHAWLCAYARACICVLLVSACVCTHACTPRMP